MSELIEKLDGIREQIQNESDYLRGIQDEIGRVNQSQARTLTYALNESRSELADLIRKETIILRAQENE